MALKNLKEKSIPVDIIYEGYKLIRICKNEDIKKAIILHKTEIKHKINLIQKNNVLDKHTKEYFIFYLKDILLNIEVIFGEF
jgi:DNA polymerase III delta prime subunit